MGTLQEALEKSGVLFYKNRFGDTATYELWNLAQFIPTDWTRRCGLCGRRTDSFYRVLWDAPTEATKSQVYICDLCFVHGREETPWNFPPLEDEPDGRSSMRKVRKGDDVQQDRRSG